MSTEETEDQYRARMRNMTYEEICDYCDQLTANAEAHKQKILKSRNPTVERLRTKDPIAKRLRDPEVKIMDIREIGARAKHVADMCGISATGEMADAEDIAFALRMFLDKLKQVGIE